MHKTLLMIALASTLLTALPADGSARAGQSGSWLEAVQGALRGAWEQVAWLLDEIGILPRDSGPYADPSGKPETSG